MCSISATSAARKLSRIWASVHIQVTPGVRLALSFGSPYCVTLNPPAGLLRRVAALAYDALLLLAIMLIYTFMIWLARGGREISPGTLWYQSSLAVLAMLFYAWFWTHGGQTLGMRAWKIRLEGEESGRSVTWRQAIARFWLAWLAALPVAAGFWWSCFDPKRRCWHDRLTRTRIVRLDLR